MVKLYGNWWFLVSFLTFEKYFYVILHVREVLSIFSYTNVQTTRRIYCTFIPVLKVCQKQGLLKVRCDDDTHPLQALSFEPVHLSVCLFVCLIVCFQYLFVCFLYPFLSEVSIPWEVCPSTFVLFIPTLSSLYIPLSCLYLPLSYLYIPLSCLYLP